jgi:hypothetical protein
MMKKVKKRNETKQKQAPKPNQPGVWPAYFFVDKGFKAAGSCCKPSSTC